MTYATKEPIPKGAKALPSKEDRVEELNLILQYEDGEIKAENLVKFAENYYLHYGIEMPPEVWIGSEINALIYPKDAKVVKKALVHFKDHAETYHREHTPRIEIENKLTRMTLAKVLKKTFIGSRADEMGVDGSTKRNLENGYITKPALKLIIDKGFLKHPLPSDFRTAFEPKEKDAFSDSESKCKWIAKQLKLLLK